GVGEGEDSVGVVRRRGVRLVPTADQRMRSRVDGDGPADPARVRGAFAVARRPRAKQGRQQKIYGNGAAHGPVLPRFGPTLKERRADSESRPSLYPNSRGRQFNGPLRAAVGADL